MSLLLKERDYVVDNGSVAAVTGGEAMVNEVLFRLTARRGSFPLMPELGSRLYQLRREKPSAWAALAAQYAAEALSDLPELEVTGAAVNWEGDALTAAVSLLWNGAELTVTAQLEG